MSRESVTYRLGVSGDQEIRATLAAIGESGDSSAKRIARSFERDMRTVEATADRAKRRFEQLQALGGSAVQRRIAESTGLAQSEFGNTKSAEASMQAFVRQQDALTRSRERLLAQADPLFAAQQRYNATMAEAMRLDRAGALAKGDLAKVQARAKAELDGASSTLRGHSSAMANATKNANLQRMGFQQLSYQVADVGASYASGINPMIIFAQQGTQVVQSVALMSTAKSRLAAFLTGPWGLAVMGGVSVLGILATSYMRSRNAAEDAKDTQYDFAKAIDFSRLSVEEMSTAMEQLVKDTEAAIRVQGDFAQMRLVNAEAAASAIDVDIAEKQAEIRDARAKRNTSTLGGPSWIWYNKLIGDLEDQLAQLRKERRQAEAAIDNAQIAAVQARVEEGLDPVAKARGEFERKVGELNRRFELSRDDPISASNAGVYIDQAGYEREFERLEKLKNKAIEDAREIERERRKRERDGDKPGLAETTAAGLLAEAKTYIGLSENRAKDNSTLQAFFRDAGINIDPKMTAWCAAFVNAVLAADGLPGTDSLAARSFLDYGKPTDAPKKGDIVVLKRGQNPEAGHVGFFDGFDAQGNPILVSGNAGGGKAVTRQSFAKSDVLGYRSVGSPGEMLIERAKQDAQQKAQNEAAVRQLMEAASPFLVISNRLEDELAKIDTLEADGPAKGGIGSEQAEILRDQARQRARKAELETKVTAIGPQLDYATKFLDEADEKDADYAKRLGGAKADQAEAMAFLELEAKMLGASVREREAAIAQFEYIADLKRQGLDLSDEEVRKLIEGNAEWFRRRGLIDEANEQLERQRQLGEQIIDTLLDPSGWDDWGEMGKRVLNMLIQEFLLLAAINPLKNAMFGTDHATLGKGGLFGFLGGIFGGGKAGGSEYTQAGFFEVGEFGKELVRLPRGSQVVNANRTRAMERSGAKAAPRPIVFDMRGAVVTEDLMRQMQAMADQAARDGAQGGFDMVVDGNQRSFGGLLAV